MNLVVLIEVQPGSISTPFSINAIGEDPRILVGSEINARLALGQKLIVDANVAVRRSSYRDTLIDVLPLLVVVDFAGAWPAENLELQLDSIVI